MKKITKLFTALFFIWYSKLTYAVGDDWILGGWWVWGDPERCITAARLRTWDMHLDDIPCMVKGMIDIFMGFAATISVIFIIIGGYQILYWSLEGNKTKWKETITMALGGFALAAFAWLIVKFILDNFA